MEYLVRQNWELAQAYKRCIGAVPGRCKLIIGLEELNTQLINELKVKALLRFYYHDFFYS